MEDKTKNELNDGVSKEKVLTKSELTSFAMDIGFSIAIPLAGFVFIGKLIDSEFHTEPLFLIFGLILSLISTTIVMIKKIKNILK